MFFPFFGSKKIMQLFSADAIVFSKKFKKFLFGPEKVKKQASKLLIIGPNLLFHSPAHSPELIFHTIKYREQASVLLSVLTTPLANTLPVKNEIRKNPYPMFNSILGFNVAFVTSTLKVSFPNFMGNFAKLTPKLPDNEYIPVIVKLSNPRVKFTWIFLKFSDLVTPTELRVILERPKT